MDNDIESTDDIAKALMIDVRFSLLFSLDQKTVNTDTFITSFRKIHSAKIISTNLANRSFDYVIIGSNPNLKPHKSDSFTYINSERYTLDDAGYSGDR